MTLNKIMTERKRPVNGPRKTKKAKKYNKMAGRKGSRPAGRPTRFKKEYIDVVRKVALLGATDAEIADVLGVSVSTVDVWKRERPEFLQALKEGKTSADAQVAGKLFERALGFAHKAVKIFCDPKSGAAKKIPYVEQYPPDTTACIFWLKNRQKELWRDKLDVSVGKVTLEDAVAESMNRSDGASK